jgi:hypothetical protein
MEKRFEGRYRAAQTRRYAGNLFRRNSGCNMNSLGEFFGDTALETVLKQHPAASGGERLKHIIDAVKSHTTTHPQSDDITIVTAKRTSADLALYTRQRTNLLFRNDDQKRTTYEHLEV